MFVLQAVAGMLGMAASGLTLGLVFLGIPWALYTLARVRCTTDETLRVQRDILRELRQMRSGETFEASAPDDTADPPKQPLW